MRVLLTTNSLYRTGSIFSARNPYRAPSVRSIEKSVGGLLEVAGKVGANTVNIPQLEATAPVLALIVDEAVIQDGYMNALTDGFDDR